MSPDQTVGGKGYIHYDPERVDYSVTGEELTKLSSGSSNLWRDACLVSGPLGVSCLINAIADTKDPFVLDLPLFLNYLFGVLGIVLAFVFGVAWYRTHQGCVGLVDAIKKKPKMQITTPATVNVGSLSTAEISPAAPQQNNAG